MGKPDTRRREIVGILATLAIVLIAYREVAFAGKTFDTSALTAGVNGFDAATAPKVNAFRVDPGASAWQMVPWAQVAHREVVLGTLPFWNPYQGAGAPLAANTQSAVFDPLSLAILLHPTTLIWDLSFLVAFLLGGVATYLFLRNLGLSLLASLAGTAAFVMSGFFATGNNLSFIRLYCYLPALLLMVDKLTSSTRFRWVVGFGALTAGCILGGMLEVALFVFTATGAYAIYRLIGAEKRRAATLRLGGATLLGLLLAAPLLVLFLGYLPLSLNQHSIGAGLRHASGASLLNWVIPFVNGYPAALRVVRFHPDRSWIGAAGAVLVVAAVAAPSLMRRHAGWLFLTVGAVLLLKVHGTPGFNLLGMLPIFAQANFVAWAPGVVSFCFAVVVAIGVRALEEGVLDRRRLVVGTLVLGFAMLVLLALNRPVLATPPHQSVWRQYLLYAVGLAAAGGVLLACVTSAWLPRLRPLTGPVAVGVMVLELLVLFDPGAFAPRADPYRVPSWLSSMTSGLVSTPQARMFGLDGKLYANTASAFGIQDARVLDGLDVQRYATFINTFVTAFSDRLTGDQTGPPDIEANPMFDLLGVRYVVAGPTPVSTTSGQYRPVVQGDVSVFENTHASPRSFVATDVHVVGGTNEAVSYLKGLGHPMSDGRVREDRFDPLTQAVAEDPNGAVAPSMAAGAQPARSVTILSYEANKVIIDVGAGAPGLLVLTDTYMPGWQATVGGRSTKVLPADVAFRGVRVGGDATRVVFSYRPPGYALVWLLPLMGVLGAATWWLVSRQRVRATAQPGGPLPPDLPRPRRHRPLGPRVSAARSHDPGDLT